MKLNEHASQVIKGNVQVLLHSRGKREKGLKVVANEDDEDHEGFMEFIRTAFQSIQCFEDVKNLSDIVHIITNLENTNEAIHLLKEMARMLCLAMYGPCYEQFSSEMIIDAEGKYCHL